MQDSVVIHILVILEDVIENYKQFQEKFAYCADTMVRGYYPSYAKCIWKQNNVVLDISEEDKKDLIEGKI